MFSSYLVAIACGLAYCIVIGLIQR